MWTRTFALFLRALRADARLLHSHLMRLVLLAFVGLMLLQAQVFALAMGAPGLWFFTFLSWINYGFATLAATFLFASAITEEKEERTLGLLRMADVGPMALLVGKSAPRLVAALLILSVQFPFTLLAITLGGVSWDQVTATFCTLLGHVVLVGGLALLFSVMFQRTGMAIGMTFLVIICLISAPPFLLSALTSPLVTPPPALQPWLEYIVPVLQIVVDASAAPRLWDILLTGFNGNAVGFQVLANFGAGGLLFGLAWLLFDPFNRNLDDEVRPPKPVLSMVGRRKGGSRRAWRLAIVGKDFRSLAGGWSMMLAKFSGYAALIVLIVYALNDFRWFRVDPEDVGEMMTIMTVYFLLPIESMVIACRLFRTEIKERTWPLLLSPPLSLPEIAYAKVAGALTALVPCAFFFWLGAVLDAGGFSDMLADFFDEPNFLLFFALYFSHLLLFVHLTTLLSLLSNAWAGALLAIFAAFIGAWVNVFGVNLPLILLQTSPGGMGMNRDEQMLYYAVAMVLSLAVVLLLVGCVHMLIGARLKSVAAQ